MARRYKYFPGMELGPYNILFIERLNNGRGYFKCPKCGREDWDVIIANVVGGNSKSCGCNLKNNPLSTIDLTGKHFGRWTVLEQCKERRNNEIYWLCECNCEKHTVRMVRGKDLRYGKSKSCGCLKEEKARERKRDISGERFGLLTAIRATDERKNGHTVWECRCDCDPEKPFYTTLGNLTQGYTKSCGCISNQSFGEKKVKDILNELKIDFKQQYYFENCRNDKTNSLLYFDFYLPDYDCCIEYDGEQHFKARKSGFFTEDKVEEIQYRDEIKNQYCKDNNIKLIRISYTDLKIINNNYILERLRG